jgi:serine/threonine-protein kinase
MSDSDQEDAKTPGVDFTGAETRIWQELADDEVQPLIEQVLPSPDARLLTRKLLGAGGMAHVEVALDVALQRRVAKKVIAPRLQTSSIAVRLFLREAQITAQLDHPSIVPVHEVGVDPAGKLYFTMKLVEGSTFKDWVSELTPRPLGPDHVADLVETAIKLCDALAFAHSRGVVHGDVKPDNVMVGRFGAVYLMDWGLAQVQDGASTRTSAALATPQGESVGGSPSYMAPEQARGEAIDSRTDVFAIGALLYYALAGHAPFAATNAGEAIQRAREARYRPLNDGAERNLVSPELERIVVRAMATDSGDRFPSVADLRQELRSFLRGSAEYPIREVAAGAHIIREGEDGDEVYILVSGRVQVYREIDGERVVLGELGPGEVFGEMAILTSSPRTASVVAVEDCVLRVLTAEILDREVRGLKPWMAVLTRTLAHRLLERESGG